MTAMQLEETSIRDGIWHGIVVGSSLQPNIEVRHLDRAIDGVAIAKNDAGWAVQVPIPQDSIADGVQTFSVFETQSGETLGQFTLIAGEALGADIRAEVELLRAELDMLKRAFRRHCVETDT